LVSRLVRGFVTAAAVFAGVYAASSPANGWDERGHRLVVEKALATLPPGSGLPGFLFEQPTKQMLINFSMAPDLLRGAGSRDWLHGAAHHILLNDKGRAGDCSPFAPEAETLGGWQDCLTRAGQNVFHVGYLPIAIREGYEKLVRGFAYWRVMTAIMESPDAPDDMKQAASQACEMWRTQIISDLGNWSHFVGDAAVPLHVSTRIGGWEEKDNPRAFAIGGIHRKFEGLAVDRLIKSDEIVESFMQPYRPGQGPVGKVIEEYILASHALVRPLYELDKRRAFDAGGPEDAVEEGRVFIAKRIAAGAMALRGLMMQAWAESLTVSVGYGGEYGPIIPVEQLVAEPLRTPSTVLGLPIDSFQPRRTAGRLLISKELDAAAPQ
jgi:hypothetical protein